MADYTAIIIAFSKDMLELVRAVMDSEAGTNLKVHKNTLTDSDLYRQLTLNVRDDGDLVFDLMLNHYIKYIESGRRAGAKPPPFKAILDWARKKGLPTDNSTIYAIRSAIVRDGISPRPIMEYVFKEMDKYWDERWADRVFEEITSELTKYFKQ